MRSTLRQLQHSTQDAAAPRTVDAGKAAAEASAPVSQMSASQHSSLNALEPQHYSHQGNMAHEEYLKALEVAFKETPAFKDMVRQLEASDREFNASLARHAVQLTIVGLGLAGVIIHAARVIDSESARPIEPLQTAAAQEQQH